MDYDVLNRIGETVMRCVLQQDTTDLFDLLHPDCELCTEVPLDPTATMSTVGSVAPPSPVVGAVSVGRATSAVYRWLQKGRQLAKSRLQCEVRRRPKPDSAGGHRGDSAGRRLYTEAPMGDPTQLSKAVVLFGRPHFLLEDTFYVATDGRVVLIVRTTVPPQDTAHAQYQKDLASFAKLMKPRPAASSAAPEAKPPVLDFSFCSVADPFDLLRVPPKAGKCHVPADVVEVAATDQAGNHPQAYTQRQGFADRVLIKARNRQGEEEAYEFTLEQEQPAVVRRQNASKDDPLAQLAGQLENKFITEAVRVCSNDLVDGTTVVPVLRSLVVDYYMSVQWLDLSANKLRTLPADIERLPLSTLYCHDNRIDSWDEVKKLCALRRLQVVTLHGNPIAEKTPEYKQVALGLLLSAPAKDLPLKSLDFVALSRVDLQLTKMHQSFHASDPKTPRLGQPSPRRATSSRRR